MKAVILITVFSLFCSLSEALPRSRYEWLWAIRHPVAAIKVKFISVKCYRIYNSGDQLKTQLDNFSNGGKLDAFRHVFFMAAFAQKVKVKKLRKLGEAHEKGNYRQFLRAAKEEGELPDSLGTVMDLKNNETGFSIGLQYKRIGLEELKELVITDIKQGKALIIKRKKNGSYLDCSGQVIDLAVFQKSWSVPKCLVSSDTKYQ